MDDVPRFRVYIRAYCRLLNTHIDTSGSQAIIDTGCPVTFINMNTLARPDKEVLQRQDVNYVLEGLRKPRINYGVTDIKRDLKQSNYTEEFLLTDAHVTFRHIFTNIVVNDYDLGDVQVAGSIGYVQKGDSLLGISFLKRLLYFCGKSKITGEHIFLGCLRTNITHGFVQAVFDHFGFLSSTDEMLSLINLGVFTRNDPLVEKEYIL